MGSEKDLGVLKLNEINLLMDELGEILNHFTHTRTSPRKAKYIMLIYSTPRVFNRYFQGAKVDNVDEVTDDIYFKPYCRIPPYVMGLVLGYVLYKQFSRKFILPWVRIFVILNYFLWL
jgi:hypothetical protein